MPDYKKSKIYKLVSNQTNSIYVGSTTQTLALRIAGHRREYKKWMNDNNHHYLYSYKILEYDDADIILIENFECNNKDELHARERHHIELNKDIITNHNIPHHTQKEYKEEHKELYKKIRDDYYKNNKENHNAKCKKFRLENKEYYKEYRQKNKDKINKQRRDNKAKKKIIIDLANEND